MRLFAQRRERGVRRFQGVLIVPEFLRLSACSRFRAFDRIRAFSEVGSGRRRSGVRDHSSWRVWCVTQFIAARLQERDRIQRGLKVRL